MCRFVALRSFPMIGSHNDDRDLRRDRGLLIGSVCFTLEVSVLKSACALPSSLTNEALCIQCIIAKVAFKYSQRTSPIFSISLE